MSKRGRPRKPLGGLSAVHVVRRPTGWAARVRYRDPASGSYTLIQRTAPTQRAARARLDAAIATLVRTGQTGTAGVTLADALTAWLEAGQLRWANATGTRYADAAGIISASMGGLTMSELTAQRIGDYLADTAAERAGWKIHRAVLRGVCAHAVASGWLMVNPSLSAPAPVDRRPRREVDVLGLEALGDLYRALESPTGEHQPYFLRDAVAFALGTGARLGELLAMHWDAIEWGDDTVVTLGWHITEDGQRVENRKAGGEPVVMRISDRLRDILAERRESVEGEMVFPSRAGTYRTRQNAARALREWRQRVSFPHEFTFHTLRHTVISTVVHEHGMEAGGRLGGHRSLQVTEQHYVERRTRVTDEVMESLNAIAPPPAGMQLDPLGSGWIRKTTPEDMAGLEHWDSEPGHQ